MRCKIIPLAFVAACLATACRNGDKAEGAGKTAVSSPAAAPAATTEPAVEAATPSADISGAYLVKCSSITDNTFDSDRLTAEPVSACVLKSVKTKDSATPDAPPTVEVETSRGVIKPAVLAPKVANTPWALGFNMSPADYAALKEIRVNYQIAGQSAVARTDNDEYRWRDDPVFTGLLAVIRGLQAILNPDTTTTFDKEGGIAEYMKTHPSMGLVFVTDEVHSGNLGGIAGADALCDTAIRTLRPDLHAIALLSTSGQNMKDRLSESGVVANLGGASLTNEEQRLWGGKLASAVRYGPSLRGTVGPLQNVEPLDYNQMAWTGAHADGTVIPGGTCDDWTSDDPALTGEIGDEETFEHWLEGAARVCSHKARLLCYTAYTNPS